MDTLPEDILLIILNQLSYIDNINLLKVNKTFNKFIRNNNHISLNDIVNLNKIDEPDKLISIFPNIKFKYNAKFYYHKNDDKLFKYIKNIYTLDLSFTDITNISMLGNVHNLNLSNTKVSDRTLECGALNNVHTLDLTGCQNITDVSALTNVHCLKVLYLSEQNNITKESLAKLVHVNVNICCC